MEVKSAVEQRAQETLAELRTLFVKKLSEKLISLGSLPLGICEINLMFLNFHTWLSPELRCEDKVFRFGWWKVYVLLFKHFRSFEKVQ